MNQVKHLDIVISGHVQGVGFRHFVKVQAGIYGIKGFVKNKANGDVYIEAEGFEDHLYLFINQCRKGSLPARVENIESNEAPVKGFQHFDVTF